VLCFLRYSPLFIAWLGGVAEAYNQEASSSGVHPSSSSMVSRKISTLCKRIQVEFRKNANQEKAAYMANYMRKSPPTPYHGLQSPERRALQKQVVEETGFTIDSRNEYETCIRELWKLPYREEKHFGIDLALQ